MLRKRRISGLFDSLGWHARWSFAVFLVIASMMTATDVSAEESAQPDSETFQLTDDDRTHWSYQPVRNPKIPAVKLGSWPRNSIDYFVLARLEQAKLAPSTEVSQEMFLRRIFLDVLGFPPTLKEQRRFLDDPSEKAVKKLVDSLLARPGYGERWGRHWLDVVRYADTNGYERDSIKPSVWRYRDYVIDALNKDKPYDRFILEQLAGDELPDSNSESVIATSFYRLGPWDDEPADPQQDRYDQLDDITRTTGEAFLGMTVGCARCHDHKYEAFSTHDYYSMVAVFNTLKRPQSGRTELDRPAGSRVEIAKQADRDRQIAELKTQVQSIRNQFQAEFLKSGKCSLPKEAVAAFLAEPGKRNDQEKALVSKYENQLQQEIQKASPAEFKQKVSEKNQRIQHFLTKLPDLPQAYVMEETSPQVPESRLLLRGRASSPGRVVHPMVPTVLVKQQPKFLEPGKQTSRTRLSYARWVADEKNPLTARVIVNRIWQQHFDFGIVRSANDFGIMGEPPTHPELLDWLAHWFMHDAKWSLKELHRLILTSSTYRMSQEFREAANAVDLQNELFWRFPSRRLSVEALRDSMLSVSGQLNRKMHGPGTYLYVPKEALEGHSDPGKIWKPFNEGEASRRTVYAFVKRSLVVPILESLDLCDTTRSSEQRKVTSIPPQALILFNGNFVNRQSEHLTNRLIAEVGVNQKDQVVRAYQLALCRVPSKAELDTMQNFLDQQRAELLDKTGPAEIKKSEEQAQRLALIQLCRVIYNLNEFAYPN